MLTWDAPGAWGAWLSTQAPALPAPATVPWAWHAGWAVVLAALTLALTGRLPRTLRIVLAGTVGLWTLLAGSGSPAFALGLVFQAPSLVMVALCARAVWVGFAPAPLPARAPSALAIAWGVCAVLLGWALLLDSFALLPLQLYAAGFSRACLLAVLVLLGALWVLCGKGAHGLAACLLAALLLFTLGHWPSGNLWDALLDPLLWVYLQLRGLAWLLRTVRLTARSVRPVSPATRA